MAFRARPIQISRHSQTGVDGTLRLMFLSTDHRYIPHSRFEVPCVLVVTTSVEAVLALRQHTGKRRHTLRIEWARDERLALDMALRLEPRLVLLDHQFGHDSNQRLRRHLARVLPEVTCYVCNARDQVVDPPDATSALHWDELPYLLHHWMPRYQVQRPVWFKL